MPDQQTCRRLSMSMDEAPSSRSIRWMRVDLLGESMGANACPLPDGAEDPLAAGVPRVAVAVALLLVETVAASPVTLVEGETSSRVASVGTDCRGGGNADNEEDEEDEDEGRDEEGGAVEDAGGATDIEENGWSSSSSSEGAAESGSRDPDELFMVLPLMLLLLVTLLGGDATGLAAPGFAALLLDFLRSMGARDRAQGLRQGSTTSGKGYAAPSAAEKGEKGHG